MLVQTYSLLVSALSRPVVVFLTDPGISMVLSPPLPAISTQSKYVEVLLYFNYCVDDGAVGLLDSAPSPLPVSPTRASLGFCTPLNGSTGGPSMGLTWYIYIYRAPEGGARPLKTYEFIYFWSFLGPMLILIFLVWIFWSIWEYMEVYKCIWGYLEVYEWI